MLRKETKIENNNAPIPNAAIEETKSFSASNPVNTNENTIIGENISIEGSIRGEENLVIEGSMKGNIELKKHNFTVGSKGRFEGEIQAQNVAISGQVLGNIKTQGKVEITKEADFIGDIKAKNFLVEEGAYFKGSIELEREPHRKVVPTEKTTTVGAAQPPKGSGDSQDKKAGK